MRRKAFYSFHYEPDNWRAAQVRQMGALEGNQPVSDNDWERITSAGDKAIKQWISSQMAGKSAVIVLIGNATAQRKWINYEIVEGWNVGKGVLGIYIHGLKDANGNQAFRGLNPFDHLIFQTTGRKMSTVVPIHSPRGLTSTEVYADIARNIDAWVEDAIALR